MFYNFSYKIIRRIRKIRKFKSKKKNIYFFTRMKFTLIILFNIFILKPFIFQNNSIFFIKILNQFDKIQKNKNYNYNKKEIIENYLSSISPRFQKYIDNEKKLLEKYLNLTDFSKNISEKEKSEAKKKLLTHFLSLLTKNNFNEIKYIWNMPKFFGEYSKFRAFI